MAYSITTIGDALDQAEVLGARARQIAGLLETLDELGRKSSVFTPDFFLWSAGKKVVAEVEARAKAAASQAAAAASSIDPRRAAMRAAVGAWGAPPAWAYRPERAYAGAAAAGVLLAAALVVIHRRRGRPTSESER